MDAAQGEKHFGDPNSIDWHDEWILLRRRCERLQAERDEKDEEIAELNAELLDLYRKVHS